MFLAHSATSSSNWDYTALLPIFLLAILYTAGVIRLKGYVQRWQIGLVTLGFILLGVAVVSPLDANSDELFSAHMLQHLILILAIPPLWIAGGILTPLAWGLPGRGRRVVVPLFRYLHAPLLVWLLHTGAVWLWHIPTLYEAALESSILHWLEHITFMGTALLYWWVIVYPPHLNYGISVLSSFGMMMQCSLLGALLTFAGSPWYPSHIGGHGLTALEDQQLAGLLMWLPAGIIYLGAAAVLLNRWLDQMDKRQKRAVI